MKTLRQILKWLGLSILAFATISVCYVWFASARKLNKKYEVNVPALRIPTDSVSIARGEHITRAMTCTLCHGEGLRGAVYEDMGPLGIVAGPNLTTGEGGVSALRSDEDLIRAIRFGVRRDSTSMMLMPSEVFVHMTDEDLSSVVAYIRQLAPVNNSVPQSRFGPMGRALLAAGKFNLLVASKTPRLTAVAAVSREPSAQYGRYLANISGCHGCHGFKLSGGKVAGPPGLPPASNLTPSGIGTWTEADFVRAIREGRRRDGSAINEFMPWQSYRHMSDDELHSLWLYLQSVPARPFGNK